VFTPGIVTSAFRSHWPDWSLIGDDAAQMVSMVIAGSLGLDIGPVRTRCCPYQRHATRIQ